MSEFCRRFDISRKTGYKWLGRYRAEGPAGLKERFRRHEHSPNRTSEGIEEAVCDLRRDHPDRGGRKLRRCLCNQADRGKLPFEDDARGSVNTFRQQLQIAYVQRLSAVIDPETGSAFDTMARSAALMSLRDVQRMLRGKSGPDAETAAHTEHVRFLIDKALATG